MLGLFGQEVGEHLETLENDLIALAGRPENTERYNRLFRATHRVKGLAGFFGFTPIHDLAQAMARVMALLRDGRMIADRDLINRFIAGAAKLKAMVADPAQAAGIDTVPERTAFHARLRLVPPDEPGAPAQPLLPSYLSGFHIDPELVRNALHHHENTFVMQLNLHLDIEASGQSLLDYFSDIEALGTLIDTVTELSGPDHGGGLVQEVSAEVICLLLFSTAMEPDLLLNAFNLPVQQLMAVPVDLLRDWLKTQSTLSPANPASAPAS